MKDLTVFRQYLDQSIAQYPELFPAEIAPGYGLHGFRRSAKLRLVSRRLRLVSNGQAYPLRPACVMPHRLGETETVEKGLYLRRFGVPYEAIASVRGTDPLYWYRASLAFGRPSIIDRRLTCSARRNLPGGWDRASLVPPLWQQAGG